MKMIEKTEKSIIFEFIENGDLFDYIIEPNKALTVELARYYFK